MTMRAALRVVAVVLPVLAACGSGIPFPHDGGAAADVPVDVPAPVDLAASEALAPDVCDCAPESSCTEGAAECRACEADGDCRDGDVCTEDRCDAATRACVYTPISGCCASDAACDDRRACTQDRCEGKTCVHEPVGSDCCEDATECADEHAATDDRCEETVCIHAIDGAPETCVVDPDCADWDPPCTPAYCAENPCDASTCDENPCTAGTCVLGHCTFGPAGGRDCCLAAVDCDDADVCTDDYCVNFRCIHTLAREPREQVVLGFEDADTAGVTLAGGTGDVAWHATDLRGFDSPWSLYFGDPARRTYTGVGAVEGTATLAPVALPGGGSMGLRFRTFLDIEAEQGAQASVEILFGSDEYDVVWDESAVDGSTGGAWSPKVQAVDLRAYEGRTIRVRFRFASAGLPESQAEGWFVDDVRLEYPCAAP